MNCEKTAALYGNWDMQSLELSDTPMHRNIGVAMAGICTSKHDIVHASVAYVLVPGMPARVWYAWSATPFAICGSDLQRGHRLQK